MLSHEQRIDDLCYTLSSYNSITTLLKDASKKRWNRLNSVGWIVFYSIKWRNVSPLLFSLECCLHCWTNNWWWVAQIPLLFISFPFETLPSRIHVHALMIKRHHHRPAQRNDVYTWTWMSLRQATLVSTNVRLRVKDNAAWNRIWAPSLTAKLSKHLLMNVIKGVILSIFKNDSIILSYIFWRISFV